MSSSSPRTLRFRAATDFFGDLSIVFDDGTECLPLTNSDLFHLRYKLEKVIKWRRDRNQLPLPDDEFWSSDLERIE